MEYQKLRKFLLNSKKYPGCKKYERAPLIHEGFPGTFNLSFAEYNTLKEFGNYTDFSHDLIFSTIQSCIRPQDILENIKENKELWKYLGVFEMSDIAGQIILKEKNNIKKIHSYQLNKLIEILTKLGLKKEKIFPSYHAGGKISIITDGKYNFDFEIPEDSFTKEEFIKTGIPKENLIPNLTRNTFLSLHLLMPTPWGYRYEINYNVGTKEKPILLDIATLEYFLWLPIYSSKEKISKNIIGLKPINSAISLGGIGVERLCLAINKLQNVFEINYLKEFYNLFRELYPKISEEQRIKSGESLRVLHRIFSDITSDNISHLGHNRKNKIKWFLQILIGNIKNFNRDNFLQLLKLHSKIQPWHENLSKGIKPTMKRIETYYSNKNLDRKRRISFLEKEGKK